MVMGRPEYKPSEADRQRVFILVASGVPQEHIARVLEISEHTLRKYYREELDNGVVEANRMVAASLFSTAIKGGKEGSTAAIFWLKCRARWREDDSAQMLEAIRLEIAQLRPLVEELEALKSRLGTASAAARPTPQGGRQWRGHPN